MLGPFTFFNAQKTKYLQILTSVMRWIGKNTIILQYFLFSIQGSVFAFHCSQFALFGFLALYFCLHQHIFPVSLCLPPFLSSRPPSPVWLPRSGPSIMVRSCSVSLIPISSHSSAWQPWQPVPSLIGPSLTGRRAKINRPSWVRA